MVEYSIQLLSVHIKLVLTVRLKAYRVTLLYALRYKIVIRVYHNPHEWLIGEWLFDVALDGRYWLHETEASVSIPSTIMLIHIELVRLNKKDVVSEKAPATLTPTLDVVVEFEYVVVHEQGVTFLHRALIFIRNLKHLSITIGETMVFLGSVHYQVYPPD